MIYIDNKRVARTIAAATGDVQDLEEVCLTDGYLTLVYTSESGKENVDVPCDWHIYMYDKSNALKVRIENIEMRFKL